MKKVTVIIPNWNGMKYLKCCLDSLEKQDTDDFMTLVIDNASEDGSADFIREHYPDVKIEVLPENTGFSGGVNTGIQLAGTPYVLLLNNDIEADRSFVRILTESIEESPKAFSVSAKMIRFSERELLDDAGDLVNLLGWAFQRGTGLSIEDRHYQKKREIFSACAGAAIYRREAFEKIGLFDTAHFAYLEDVDIGYRARMYGYDNYYEPGAVVYHIGSGSSEGLRYSDFKVRLSSRNGIYLIYKNMTPLQKIINGPAILAGRAVKAYFFKKAGFKKAYDEGIREGRLKKRSLTKVPYRVSAIPDYLKIEWMLIKNCFVYASETLERRKMKKSGRSL